MTSAFGVLRKLAADASMAARSQLARAAGLTFGGKRDLRSVLGYKEWLGPDDYRDRYERGDIAAAVIEAKPTSTWRGMSDTGGAEVIDDDTTEDLSPFELAFVEMDARLNVVSRWYAVDIVAGQGDFGVLMIFAPGDVSTPLPRVGKPEDIALLQCFGQEDVNWSQEDLVKDTADKRFGMPEFYKIAGVTTLTGASKRVHWSRVIHVPADVPLKSDLYAQPRLKRIWNRLDDLDKVVGGGSEAFWMRANQGYVFNMDPDIELAPGSEGEKKMSDELDEFFHAQRRALRLTGVDVKTLGSDVADFRGPVSALIELISAATGIPQRILMGSERGELASSQDATAWNDRIRDRRTLWAMPYVVNPFVWRLIDCGALPPPKDNKFHMRWPDGQSMDINQKMDLVVKATRANAQQGTVIITDDEMRSRILGYPVLTNAQRAVVTPRTMPGGGAGTGATGGAGGGP